MAKKQDTKLGVSHWESVVGTDTALLRRLDEFADEVGRMPAYYPVWNRCVPGAVRHEFPHKALELIKERGVQPVVFMESVHEDWAWDSYGYKNINAGVWDEHFTEWGKKADGMGLIVRFDQEPNGFPAAPWTGHPPIDYRRAFRRVSKLVRLQAPDTRFFYCPIWRGPGRAYEEFRAYYPGDEAVQIMGFDLYDNGKRSLPELAQASIAACREIAPGKPRLIGELGTNARVRPKGRARWLRGLHDTRVAGAIYFDIDMPGDGTDYTMTRSMKREFATFA